jgi:RimJ/RimL family protein N-acetyltransferase
VRLRAFTDADAEAILEAAGDYSMHRWLALDRPLPDLASVRRWIQDGHLLYKRGGGLRVAVVETSSAQLLGCVELNFPSPDRERANVGYWTMPRERKHGVASQALALLCDWAFTHDLTQTIDLLTLPGNVASERVALACNFSLADDVLISYDRRLEREVAFNVFSRSH